MDQLDEKNCMILNILQKNCRASLTEIAETVNLSVDSVKKRIHKMLADGIFVPKIQLRPRVFGFKNIVDIKVKVHNYEEKDLKEFIEFLKNHPAVAELIALSGEWDFTLVILAKDHQDLGTVTDEIRNKFGRIILEWSESLTTRAHKFETYDMLALKKYYEGR